MTGIRRAIATAAAAAVILAACSPSPASPAPGTDAPTTPVASASASSAIDATSPGAPSPSTAGASATSGPPADVAVELAVEDIVAPIGLVAGPPGDDRSFVLDQTGLIYLLRDGVRAERPFLDIRDRLVQLDTEYDERGLLGLAFDPAFTSTRRFFVYYGAPRGAEDADTTDHLDRLSSFEVDTDDPDIADPTSEQVILEFGQPQPNHSGGGLGFGPDGLLYLGTGDGGGTGDASPGHSAQGNAQDLDKLNGKILRIGVLDPGDTTDGARYAIPEGNPFADGGGRPEIFAYGFRNPWRLTWEPDGERRLLVSDVGYGRYEEVDAVEVGGNYGWRIREGAHCLDVDEPLAETTDCPPTGADGEPLIDPVVEYTHREVGIAVVGGYVYRGSAIPALRGRYVFGDYTADWTTNQPDPHGSLLVADPAPTADATWPWARLTIANDPLEHAFLTGMGEDAAGELYLMTRRQFGPIGVTGEVYRVVPVS